MMSPITVMLVDDNPTFLRVAAQFLEANDDVVVVGTAGDGDEALERAVDLEPQVVLVDLAMPGLPGLEAIPHLRLKLPNVGIIALTVMNTFSFREAALSAGADVFIPKAAMRTDLLPAIRRLVAADRGREDDVRLSGDQINDKERRVLVMEDDDYLRRLYAKALGAAGYKVYTAGTVQEARGLLVQIPFNVLLCDVQMGSDRGTDLLREYAGTLFTGGAQVIMVSGQPQYRDACEHLGVDFFLEKPVSVGTLVALVDRITGRTSRPSMT